MSPPSTSLKTRFRCTNGPATRVVVKIASPMPAKAIMGDRVRRKNQTSPCNDGGTMPLIIMETMRTGAVSTSTTTQMAATGITAGRVCWNPLPRIFLFISMFFPPVSAISL